MIDCLQKVNYMKLYQVKSKFLLAALFNLILISSVYAALRPLTPSELINKSGLVLTGEIINIQVSTENSHIEKDSGNYDWAIDLTIKINDVEKGLYDNSDTIVVRCIRVKSRSSKLGYFGPGGNNPIPGIGTMVRAHLYKSSDLWRIVLPNGLTSVSGGVELTNADILHKLRNKSKPLYLRLFNKSKPTYFLLGVKLAAFFLWIVFVIKVVNWLFRKGLLQESIINPEEKTR